MSIEAYKIAVQIALTDKISSGLVALSGHFARTNISAKELEERVARINKLTLVGGMLGGAGTIGLDLLKEPLNKAMEYERYIAQMRQMGLGDAQIEDAKKFITATNIINTSLLDRARIFTEAQGSFRESGKDGAQALAAAEQMTPILATYEVASATLSGPSHAAAESAMRNLNKTVEIMGGLGNTEKAKAIVDGVFKAVQSSGRMVDERQLKQFVAYGSSATNSIDPRAIFGGLEPIIGELGGSTVGTGLRTAFTRMSGAMSMPPQKMQATLKKLGIGQVENGQIQLRSDLLKLEQKDPVAFARKMMGIYAQHGLGDQLDRERLNAILFNTNGAKVYNKIMQQMPVIEESLKSYDRAKGVYDTANDPQNKRLMALQNFNKKVEDLELVIGQNGGLIDMATKALTWFGSAVQRVTTFAEKHPELTKLAVEGFAMVSALALVGGTLLMIKAAFLGLMLLSPGKMFMGTFGFFKNFHEAMLWLNTARKWNPDVGPIFKRLASSVSTGLRAAGARAMSGFRALRSVASHGLKAAGALLRAAGMRAVSVLRIMGSGALRVLKGAGMLLRIVGTGGMKVFRILMSGIATGLRIVGQATLWLGRALLANPIGLVVAGIAMAALLLWNNWKEIKTSLLTIWNSIKEGFIRLFHGDFLGMWHSFSGAFLLGFQTLFNTIIAALDKIPGVALKKLDFATQYINEHRSLPGGQKVPNPNGGSPNVVVTNRQPVQVKTTINMDGRKVAEAVTQHQAREAARPNISGPGFDSSLSPMQVGMLYAP